MKTYEEICRELNTKDLRQKFIHCFSLRILLEDCLIKEDYQAHQDLDKLIVLSSEGEIIAKELQNVFPGTPKQEIKLAIFVKLFYENIFIDLNQSNLESIESIFSQEIILGKIKYPWVFDRVLYDRFFENFPNPNHQQP